jgi:hypothetical protein
MPSYLWEWGRGKSGAMTGNTTPPPVDLDGGLGTRINRLTQNNVLLPEMLSLWRANRILLT